VLVLSAMTSLADAVEEIVFGTNTRSLLRRTVVENMAFACRAMCDDQSGFITSLIDFGMTMSLLEPIM
jgi:hypothetical protein